MAAAARDNVAATGNQRIDGLLTGLAWASPVVSYGFPTQRSDYESGYADPAVDVGLAPLSLGQQQAFRQMAEGTKPFPGGPTFTYGSVEAFTNLSLDEAVPSSADIRLAVSGLPTSAYAYYPTLVYPLMTTPPEAGDQFFTTGFGNTPVMPGNKVWHMHLHEFGHSLGLKHAHEAGGIAGGPVPTAFDSLEFTAMTYRPHVGASAEYGFPEPDGNPQTFMMLDIAALQHMYGADFSTNSGNTTYSWNPATGEMSVNGVAQGAPSANRVFLTVWDGGGTDTYDMSNYGGGTSIDLAPGGSSVTSLEQRALLNYADVVFNGAAPIYARGTVFNALQYNGDSRSLIENATGGAGNDVISGNDAANVLNGGGGADTITGGRGYDQMAGGAGADTFVFNYGDGAGLPHDAITDFQVGVDKLLLPTGAAVQLEADAAGQWVHYGADLGNNDWVQLKGVQGATIAQLTGGGSPPPPPPPPGPTAGNDTLNGTSGADAINALAGNDSVNGGDGADTITGGLGYDQMTGGAGADVFAFNIGDGAGFPHDAITDFQVGVDKLLFPTGAAVQLEADPGGLWVHYGANLGNNDWVQLKGVQGATIAQLTGAASPPPPPPPDPTVGNDTLNGTSGPDAINALAGNDVVNGGDGADTISGSFGYDQMTGGAGADVFAFSYNDGGSFPHDVITDFQVGVDKLLFPTGVLLHTEDDAGGQWVHYGADLGSNDWVQLKGVHGATIAQLTGANTPPPTSPTNGNDVLTGTSGADYVNALPGNDTVNGGDGNDTIMGGPGYDQMTGGTGADVFIFNYGHGGAFPHDVITDFQVGVDKLSFPTTAALQLEADPAGIWVHYGDNLASFDWVQLMGVQGATIAQLIG